MSHDRSRHRHHPHSWAFGHLRRVPGCHALNINQPPPNVDRSEVLRAAAEISSPAIPFREARLTEIPEGVSWPWIPVKPAAENWFSGAANAAGGDSTPIGRCAIPYTSPARCNHGVSPRSASRPLAVFTAVDAGLGTNTGFALRLDVVAAAWAGSMESGCCDVATRVGDLVGSCGGGTAPAFEFGAQPGRTKSLHPATRLSHLHLTPAKPEARQPRIA